MLKLKGIGKSIFSTLEKRSPEILLGIGLAGMLTSTVLACKATPKFVDLINRENEYLEDENQAPLTKFEMFKMGLRPYAPAIFGYCVSAICILGANYVKENRHVALLATAQIGERAFNEYKNKVIEVIGEEKEKEVRDSIAKDKVEHNIPDNEVIIMGSSTCLCHDILSGRYFESSTDILNRAVNDLNFQMLNENYVSVNDFYDMIGLTCTPTGYVHGWNINNGPVQVHYSAQMTSDGRPCISISYVNFPTSDYQTFR